METLRTVTKQPACCAQNGPSGLRRGYNQRPVCQELDTETRLAADSKKGAGEKMGMPPPGPRGAEGLLYRYAARAPAFRLRAQAVLCGLRDLLFQVREPAPGQCQ